MADAAFKKQLWVSAAIILGSMIVAGVGLSALAAHLNRVASEILATRQAVAQKSGEYGLLARLKADAASAASYGAAMDKLLPSQDGVISFPAQVAKLSQQDGASVNFSFQGDAVPAAAAAPGNIAFTLNATGPLANLLSFFKDLEARSPVIFSSFDAFDLSRNGSGYTIAAQGRVFFK